MLLLEVKNLVTHFKVKDGWVKAVDNVSITIEEGQTLGLVGESGCGKTTLGYSITQLLPNNAVVKQGSIIFNGRDLLAITRKKDGTLREYHPEITKIRWKQISMIFQGAMNAFNPVYRVGDQIIEAIKIHEPDVPKDYPSGLKLHQIELVELARKAVRSSLHGKTIESSDHTEIRQKGTEMILAYAQIAEQAAQDLLSKYGGQFLKDGKKIPTNVLVEDALPIVRAKARSVAFPSVGASHTPSAVAHDIAALITRYLTDEAQTLLGEGEEGRRMAENLANMIIRFPNGAAKQRVRELYRFVGIPLDRIDNYPHEYSGGMKQRAMIAMALVLNPKFIIADEPTTALDVIMQRKILKEMQKLQREFHMSMIIISHDVSVVAEIANHIAVMYAGKVMEYGAARQIFKETAHPYAEALLGAFPSIRGAKKRLATIPGNPPSLLNPPKGCRFHPRCRYAGEICAAKEPAMVEVGTGHFSHCHFAREFAAKTLEVRR